MPGSRSEECKSNITKLQSKNYFITIQKIIACHSPMEPSPTVTCFYGDVIVRSFVSFDNTVTK